MPASSAAVAPAIPEATVRCDTAARESTAAAAPVPVFYATVAGDRPITIRRAWGAPYATLLGGYQPPGLAYDPRAHPGIYYPR